LEGWLSPLFFFGGLGDFLGGREAVCHPDATPPSFRCCRSRRRHLWSTLRVVHVDELCIGAWCGGSVFVCWGGVTAVHVGLGVAHVVSSSGAALHRYPRPPMSPSAMAGVHRNSVSTCAHCMPIIFCRWCTPATAPLDAFGRPPAGPNALQTPAHRWPVSRRPPTPPPHLGARGHEFKTVLWTRSYGGRCWLEWRGFAAAAHRATTCLTSIHHPHPPFPRHAVW
jgi:hypothetical protein